MEPIFFPSASFSVSMSVSTRPQVSVPSFASSALSGISSSPNMSPAPIPSTPSPVASATSLEISKTVTTGNLPRPTKRAYDACQEKSMGETKVKKKKTELNAQKLQLLKDFQSNLQKWHYSEINEDVETFEGSIRDGSLIEHLKRNIKKFETVLWKLTSTTPPPTIPPTTIPLPPTTSTPTTRWPTTTRRPPIRTPNSPPDDWWSPADDWWYPPLKGEKEL